jgi:hypothetical protein
LTAPPPRASLHGVIGTLALALLLSPPAPWPQPDFQRGIVYSSWDGTYPDRDAWQKHLDRFQALGVTWIEILTFAEQPDITAPAIRAMPPERFPAEFVREARRRGFHVFLKPDVWSRQFYDGSGKWRGSITFDDAGWARWFEQYEAFLLPQAKLAAENGVEMLSIGLEYVEATRTQEARWRTLIAHVRAAYPGLLTYAADAAHELDHVRFWDALDVIGVNAWMPVADDDSPGLLELARGWAPHLARFGAIARRYGRPLVFTEAGYPSTPDGAREPWRWPEGQGPVDLPLQARAYEALMAACTREPWCDGVFWWKWYERPERHTPAARDYTPEGKPAEGVLARWYGRAMNAVQGMPRARSASEP